MLDRHALPTEKGACVHKKGLLAYLIFLKILVVAFRSTSPPFGQFIFQHVFDHLFLRLSDYLHAFKHLTASFLKSRALSAITESDLRVQYKTPFVTEVFLN